MATGLVQRYRGLVFGAAVVVPLVACAVMATLRGSLENTNAALVLVLLVVAAASTGLRLAGLVAALSSAVWFDLFLTPPYLSFAITDRADVETTVLLLLIGGAVAEIALWGRRQQAQASRQEGFLAGVLGAAAAVAAGASPPSTLIEHVERQLVEILDLDTATFTPSVGRGLPTLMADGTLSAAGRAVDVARSGLPTDSELVLPVQSGGRPLGQFLLVAATHIARPTLEARQVAVALADQVGASIATFQQQPRG